MISAYIHVGSVLFTLRGLFLLSELIPMAREGSICHGDTAMLVLCYYM